VNIGLSVESYRNWLSGLSETKISPLLMTCVNRCRDLGWGSRAPAHVIWYAVDRSFATNFDGVFTLGFHRQLQTLNSFSRKLALRQLKVSISSHSLNIAEAVRAFTIASFISCPRLPLNTTHCSGGNVQTGYVQDWNSGFHSITHDRVFQL
jgi:hypothetical protein